MTELKLTRLSDVTAERVDWIWPGYLPVGKLATLDGDPGLGKSTLALTIAATITRGGTWPDGSSCEHPGDVLLLSAEDGLADTVRPRLDAADADANRVHAIEGRRVLDPETGETYLRPLSLADVRDLGAAMSQTGARLLIVDVLMAFLPAGTDSHKDQDIRRVLSALAAAADANRCTVLLLRHLNKAKGGDPLYRGGGSIGIVGAARSGLLVAADPADPERRVLASVKSNLGADPDALAYRLVDRPEHGVAGIVWEGAVSCTARDLLAEPGADGADDGETTAAGHWLTDYMKQKGPTASKKVKDDARKVGFSERTLKRAKKSAGVLDRPEGFPRTTVWYLDSEANREPGHEKPGPTGPTGHDQQKEVGPTGSELQSGQGREAGPTAPALASSTAAAEPMGAPTAATPGMTDRVASIASKHNAADCRCGAVLTRPESIAAGKCLECAVAGDAA